MNTELHPFARRRKAAIRRPFLLAALFFLLLFTSYFVILAAYPGSPDGRGDGAAGTGSGTAAGEGSGSGQEGEGKGGAGAAGSSGTGSSGNTKTGESMGQGKEKPTAAPSPVAPAAPSSGKTEDAPPKESVHANPLRHAAPLAIPQEKFAAVSRSEAAQEKTNALSGSGGSEGRSGGTGGSGAYSAKGFYGIKVQGNTVFLVDVSGSMAVPSLEGSRIELLKKQLEKVIRSTESGHYGIIAFSSGTRIFPAGNALYRFNRGYDREVRNFVASLPAGGCTELLSGLQALKQMMQQEIPVKTVFLLTDGEPSEPWSEILKFIRQEIPKEVVFHTISIGEECPELQKLAKERKGRYKVIR